MRRRIVSWPGHLAVLGIIAVAAGLLVVGVVDLHLPFAPAAAKWNARARHPSRSRALRGAVEPIRRRNIFDSAARSPTPALRRVPLAPVLSLAGYDLISTYVGGDVRLALLRVPGRSVARLAGPGEPLTPPGPGREPVTLARVEASRVQLASGGARAWLKFGPQVASLDDAPPRSARARRVERYHLPRTLVEQYLQGTPLGSRLRGINRLTVDLAGGAGGPAQVIVDVR